MPISIPPTLTTVCNAFDAYDKQQISFRDLLLVEQEFYLTADAESLNTYARKIGRGRFLGLHPIYIEKRTDLKKVSATTAEFGGGTWELTDCSAPPGIIKDAEYVLISISSAAKITK